MIALIDADGLLFRTCSACSTDILWSDGLITPFSVRSYMVSELETIIAKVLRDTEASQAVFYFSGPVQRTWRKTMVTPTYKGNRTGSRPVGWDHAIDWLAYAGHRVVQLDIFEADDLVGAAYGYENEEALRQVVRVSEDKDLLTVPGVHHNPRKGTTVHVSEEEANYNWLFQTLVGDSTDGYKGCPAIGAKKAPPIARGGWSAVVDAYVGAGLSEAEAIENAQLARILRPGDIENRRPRIWTP